MTETEFAEYRRQVETSLREAIYDALDRKRRLGQYAVIREKGVLKKVGPDDLPAVLARIKDPSNCAGG